MCFRMGIIPSHTLPISPVRITQLLDPDYEARSLTLQKYPSSRGNLKFPLNGGPEMIGQIHKYWTKQFFIILAQVHIRHQTIWLCGALCASVSRDTRKESQNC